MSFSSTIVRAALYALLIFTPLARGSVHGWALSVIHVATLIGVTVLLLQKVYSWNWEWIRTPLDKPIILLLVLTTVSCLFSTHPRTSFWATVLLLNYIVIFYITVHYLRTRRHFRTLIFLIIGLATFLSLFGFFKKFAINPFPWWDYRDLTYGPEFLTSTYGNHNHLAGYLEMAFFLILGLFLRDYKGGRLCLMVYLALIILTALVLSLSRGAWGASTCGLIFMASMLLSSRRFNRKKLLLFLILGVSVLLLIVLASTPVVERLLTVLENQEDASFQSRRIAWKGVIQMIVDNPLLGTGPGTFALVFTQYQPPGLGRRFMNAHNDYLHYTAELGLLLVPLLIFAIFAFYRKALTKLDNPSRLLRGITLGAVSGITAILFHSLLDFNLHIPANALLFTFLAAIVVAPRPSR
jgi:O-antigen ligase